MGVSSKDGSDGSEGSEGKEGGTDRVPNLSYDVVARAVPDQLPCGVQARPQVNYPNPLTIFAV